MTGVNLNPDTVESMLTELQDRYSEVPVEREPVDVPAGEFEDHLQNARDGYDGGAYAWVIRDPEDASQLSSTTPGERDSRRRVLMHYPRNADEWGLPGGGREGGETFEEVAVREINEKTDIPCEITDLWLLRHHVWQSDDESDTRKTHSLHVFFDAHYTGGSISIQPTESNGAAWFAELPERMMPTNEFRAVSWSTTSE
jgi:8-oxo-dGTP pyrophosphatase MutT (NUDIX family)